jgi:hypothetical protein
MTRTVTDTAAAVDRRAVDAVLFALLPVAAVPVWGFPLPELAMGLAVCLALIRTPTVPKPIPMWFPALLALFIAWMTLAALLADVPAYRRLVHLVLFIALAIFMAEGRFAMRSVAQGTAFGLLVSAGVGLFGISAFGVGTGYTGRLTGFLGDPNVAGFYLLTLGLVSVAFLPRGRLRTVLTIALAGLVLLTLSRTSILAIGLVIGWVTLGRRVRPVVNLALVAVLMIAVSKLSEQLRLLGPFAERAGSDELRDRIVLLEHIKIDGSPWFGTGPGTSTVNVNGQEFFFHSSYLALLNEGGWLAIGIFLLLGFVTLWSLARLPAPVRSPWLEAALIAAAICALNLGEVLLELPTAVVLGAAAFHLTSNTIRDVASPPVNRSATNR